MPVPENDVRYVRDGDQVTVRVDAINRSLTGKVVRFTRDVDSETRSMETEVDVENKDLSIAPGMYANAMLRLAHVDNVVTIPIEALVIQGSQQVVYVLGQRQSRAYSSRATWALKDQSWLRSRAGSSRAIASSSAVRTSTRKAKTVNPEVSQQPASETEQETGGTIDLKADEQSDTAGSDPSASVDAAKSIVPGLRSAREQRQRAGVKKHGERERDAKHVGGGAR